MMSLTALLYSVLPQVYNEQIRDLLNPGVFLPLREDPEKGVIVAGLSLHKVGLSIRLSMYSHTVLHFYLFIP